LYSILISGLFFESKFATNKFQNNPVPFADTVIYQKISAAVDLAVQLFIGQVGFGRLFRGNVRAFRRPAGRMPNRAVWRWCLTALAFSVNLELLVEWLAGGCPPTFDPMRNVMLHWAD
jgi:hypothetical protein